MAREAHADGLWMEDCVGFAALGPPCASEFLTAAMAKGNAGAAHPHVEQWVKPFPDFASFHPGYGSSNMRLARHMVRVGFGARGGERDRSDRADASTHP